MNIAVIIPFRGDPATLAWTLDGFAAQELRPGDRVEVRVQGDGVPTPAVPHNPFPNITFSPSSSDHAGVAEAKNILLRNRPADIIIVANSDTRPAPGFVQNHVNRLLSLPQNSIVLGAAPYEPTPAPTVFDILKEHTPMIFFYHQMKPHERYDFRHVWTLNLSVRYADLARIGFFNPVFRPWGFEDLDIGYKLMGETRGVYFDPACKVTHRHPMHFDQYLDREELLGAMAPVLHAANPAAFNALYGTTDIDALAETFRHWIDMDRPAHAWTYRRMREWCELPASALGEGESRNRLTMTLYQMHIPLKRLAFRTGFLWGMTTRDDSLWKERTPRSEWRNAIT